MLHIVRSEDRRGPCRSLALPPRTLRQLVAPCCLLPWSSRKANNKWSAGRAGGDVTRIYVASRTISR
jgi:hypothetical protein